MPINYKNDTDYQNKDEELEDLNDVTQAKFQMARKNSVMDFDEFLVKEGISNGIHNKDRK
jgi:hypothetical protein